MKKTLLHTNSRFSRFAKTMAATAVVGLGVNFSASAQWVVYEANVLPLAFTESPFKVASDNAATYTAASTQPVVSPQFEIIADPAKAGNNLMRFQVLGVSSSISPVPSATTPTSANQAYLFRQDFNATTKPTAATVVVRAKGLPGADRAFELDLDFAGFRETVYIINPTTNATTGQPNTTGTFTFNVARNNTAAAPEQGSTLNNAPLNINPLDWHVYRFTKEGNTVKMYIDESNTPFATGVSASTSTSNYYRIGDGSSNVTVAMELDYIVWDPSGAFSPSQKALPTSLLVLSSKGEVVKKNGLSVYPNPSKGRFSITHPSSRANASVEVYSVSGVKVVSFAAEKGNNQSDFDASSLPNGIYTVVYSDGTERVTSRIIKN
ncbi:T9SS type A sorting domain-containing protein [Rufibacter sp. LB8]|uniref:T9SS type A sorting domain-containing protein n=1 Tax=Rufibacter sp. LB8 TaxID=2777781 RepID=UPI00178C73D0|nr:T9SS type A sorting domain-containing protein [Rufibacter sp. LB8]